ncbi:hypothetical protein VOLCADRAFT_99845 [Volvox carteri f. nagariensis]|uniref:Uncharacterized protein n=1 Tax=Volvox carteri f. nagariensis TaxID=3068 RepID=D8UIT1_VOLCA|nr:uncharacterized protein VOLCADRAFT_99845 [Volvox carteri f. nagariensis]EFJ40360.1 hypothetical protein VOLCADRAFT_99845 [Volvox carteri f. nagariensis]|eukprot:XP_002958564.1 hypothetical protein VOLCADRAFT_99845 [Volvox carteri f. nagariensis]
MFFFNMFFFKRLTYNTRRNCEYFSFWCLCELEWAGDRKAHKLGPSPVPRSYIPGPLALDMPYITAHQASEDGADIHPGMEQASEDGADIQPGMEQASEDGADVQPGMEQASEDGADVQPGMEQASVDEDDVQPGMEPGHILFLANVLGHLTIQHLTCFGNAGSCFTRTPLFYVGHQNAVVLRYGYRSTADLFDVGSRPRKMGPTSSQEWSRPRKMGPDVQPGMEQASEDGADVQPGMEQASEDGADVQPGMEQASEDGPDVKPGMEMSPILIKGSGP